MQSYLAMGSLQWSQCLSPPFPFALKRWSPRPRHLLSLQPGKRWLGFRFISSSAHETIIPFPLTRSHGAHPLSRLPLQMCLLLFLGLSGPYGGSLGAGCSRGRATSSRNPPSPGGGDGSSSSPSHPFRPHSLPVLTLTGRTASQLPQHRSARSSGAPSSF